MTSFKTICLLGVTGHGKSSLANVICGENIFEANAGTTSVTEHVQGIVTTWRDISTHVPLICIDTPGFGDSEGRDPDHVDNIVTSLRQSAMLIPSSLPGTVWRIDSASN
jgi:predicted GTPase